MSATIPLSAWTTFIDPLSIGIVLGGTVLVTGLRAPLADSVAALRALRCLGGAQVGTDRARAAIAHAERIAVERGLLKVDVEDVRDRSTAAALAAIVDGAGPDRVAALIDREDAARTARHQTAQAVWIGAAEAAPAMGMIGTLVGLVRMFSRMADPSAIGGAMAVALLTTLYGALLANLVAAPVAARLGRLSALEAERRRALRQPLIDLARRFAPAPTLRRPKAAA